MGDDERVVGDPTEVLTRSGGTSYISLTVDAQPTEVESEAELEPELEAEPEPGSSTGQRRWPVVGWAALVLAATAGVLTGAGVGAAAGGEFVTGSTLAWAAIVVSGAAVLCGIVAVITGFGRLPGAIAIALGLVANPFLLTQVLGALEQFGAAAAATS